MHISAAGLFLYPKISYCVFLKRRRLVLMAEPATELNSLKRVSIVQQVEQVIADRIVDGTYAVDTKLPAR